MNAKAELKLTLLLRSLLVRSVFLTIHVTVLELQMQLSAAAEHYPVQLQSECTDHDICASLLLCR